MDLDFVEGALPSAPDHVTGGGGFYCSRCDAEDCEWLGICPHTPDLWCSLNPNLDMAKFRQRMEGR